MELTWEGKSCGIPDELFSIKDHVLRCERESAVRRERHRVFLVFRSRVGRSNFKNGSEYELLVAFPEKIQ